MLRGWTLLNVRQASPVVARISPRARSPSSRVITRDEIRIETHENGVKSPRTQQLAWTCDQSSASHVTAKRSNQFDSLANTSALKAERLDGRRFLVARRRVEFHLGSAQLYL